VEPYYRRFLEKFPSLSQLAAPPWGRCGKRGTPGILPARRQSSAPRAGVVRERDGVIPAEPSSCDGSPASGATPPAPSPASPTSAPPAVDTNVARVIRRAFHPRASRSSSDPRSGPPRPAWWPRRGKAAWVFNQGSWNWERSCARRRRRSAGLSGADGVRHGKKSVKSEKGAPRDTEPPFRFLLFTFHAFT